MKFLLLGALCCMASMCQSLDITAGAYYQQPDGSQIGAYVKLDETFRAQKGGGK